MIKRIRKLNSGAENKPRYRLKVTASLGLIALMIGCDFTPPTAVNVADYEGHSWTDPTGQGTPGIDSGAVTAVTLRTSHEDEIRVIFWSDLPAGRAGASELAGPVMVGGGSGRARYAGGHADTNGRKVGFRAETSDGRTATLTIGDQTFSSEDGKFFLISSQGESPVVKQLKTVPLDCQKTDAFYREFATSNTEIRDFFSNIPPRKKGNETTSQ